LGIDITHGEDRVNEENISAFKEMEEPCAWLFETEKNQVGEGGNQEAPPEGEEEARGVEVFILCNHG